jgi:hypothetical protein
VYYILLHISFARGFVFVDYFGTETEILAVVIHKNVTYFHSQYVIDLYAKIHQNYVSRI